MWKWRHLHRTRLWKLWPVIWSWNAYEWRKSRKQLLYLSVGFDTKPPDRKGFDTWTMLVSSPPGDVELQTIPVHAVTRAPTIVAVNLHSTLYGEAFSQQPAGITKLNKFHNAWKFHLKSLNCGSVSWLTLKWFWAYMRVFAMCIRVAYRKPNFLNVVHPIYSHQILLYQNILV